MLSEFKEGKKQKTSLAKYSLEFNDFAVQTRLKWDLAKAGHGVGANK